MRGENLEGGIAAHQDNRFFKTVGRREKSCAFFVRIQQPVRRLQAERDRFRALQREAHQSVRAPRPSTRRVEGSSSPLMTCTGSLTDRSCSTKRSSTLQPNSLASLSAMAVLGRYRPRFDIVYGLATDIEACGEVFLRPAFLQPVFLNPACDGVELPGSFFGP